MPLSLLQILRCNTIPDKSMITRNVELRGSYVKLKLKLSKLKSQSSQASLSIGLFKLMPMFTPDLARFTVLRAALKQ